MKSFAAALTLFAATNAVQLGPHQPQPHYAQPYGPACQTCAPAYPAYAPAYAPYPQGPAYAAPQPVYQAPMQHALAAAAPYWGGAEEREAGEAEVEATYAEAEALVAGAEAGAAAAKAATAQEMTRMPRQSDYKYKDQVVPNAYVLPVHQAVTPYEWYAVSGQCELTDSAYSQCVDWKQSNYRMNQRPRYHAQNPQDAYNNVYVQEVYKINSNTGMAYVDREMNQGKYHTPTYGRIDQYAAPRDLYRGTSTLPVSITDSYGLSKHGVKMVTDKGYDSKEVTIKNESSGLSNTIRLKNSQQVVHVKELDQNNDYIDDTQVLTICDDDTNTCDVVTLDLASPYVDPAYVDHAYGEIKAADAAYPHAAVGEPMLIDPYSVGADADDVCWLEDVIVGSDMYGDAVIESEVFCADAGDLYVEPLTAYAPETEAGYVEPVKAAPKRERGFSSKPKPRRAPPSKPAAASASAE